ncbi:hypothetical protein Pmani_014390 [Petrolisthes manimaculis]|uniref:Regulatory protein zeste n=1 Tax=Petrolisthes manimaculis TaxID=1843537 RepID=A0AAE1PWB9_9EUCA|nr:hypothetical protein Pmani_014390 [Petrolisthes manimaculis]
MKKNQQNKSKRDSSEGLQENTCMDSEPHVIVEMIKEEEEEEMEECKPTTTTTTAAAQRIVHHHQMSTIDHSIASSVRPQRFRKPNYTEVEKKLIFSLLLPHLEMVENKSLDRKILREKYELWEQVTKRYNAAILASGNTLVTRNIEDLRTFWKNARRKNQLQEYLVSDVNLIPNNQGAKLTDLDNRLPVPLDSRQSAKHNQTVWRVDD